MITNKDISIDSENGKITLNGNKYDLGTQGEIDTAVKDVYSVMGQLGTKNLIPYPYNDTTFTTNGVTCTDNGDGTVTVQTDENGATAITRFIMHTRASGSVIIKAGKYKLSGCPSGGSNTGYSLQATNTAVSPSISAVDTGNGADLETTQDLSMGFLITIAKDTVISTPITFKPMLRLASDTDNTYEPYAMTNKQLTDQLATKQDTLTFDTVPTDQSTNPVTSGGVYSAIGAVDSKFTNLPKAMETGKAQFPAAAIGGQDIEVQFTPGLFTTAPVVTATMSDTTPFNVGTYMEADIYVYNVTKDSFFLHGTRKNANYSWYANWIAVEM